MITIHKGEIRIPKGQEKIGYVGDHAHNKLEMLVVGEMSPDWKYKLYLQFDDDTCNYFFINSEITEKGTLLTWKILEEHIYKSGLIKMQIKAYKNDLEVYHTNTTMLSVGESIEFAEHFEIKDNQVFIDIEKEITKMQHELSDFEVEDSSITTKKIANNAITSEKLKEEYKPTIIPFYDINIDEDHGNNTIDLNKCTRVGYTSIHNFFNVINAPEDYSKSNFSYAIIDVTRLPGDRFYHQKVTQINIINSKLEFKHWERSNIKSGWSNWIPVGDIDVSKIPNNTIAPEKLLEKYKPIIIMEYDKDDDEKNTIHLNNLVKIGYHSMNGSYTINGTPIDYVHTMFSTVIVEVNKISDETGGIYYQRLTQVKNNGSFDADFNHWERRSAYGNYNWTEWKKSGINNLDGYYTKEEIKEKFLIEKVVYTKRKKESIIINDAMENTIFEIYYHEGTENNNLKSLNGELVLENIKPYETVELPVKYIETGIYFEKEGLFTVKYYADTKKLLNENLESALCKKRYFQNYIFVEIIDNAVPNTLASVKFATGDMNNNLISTKTGEILKDYYTGKKIKDLKTSDGFYYVTSEELMNGINLSGEGIIEVNYYIKTDAYVEETVEESIGKNIKIALKQEY